MLQKKKRIQNITQKNGKTWTTHRSDFTGSNITEKLTRSKGKSRTTQVRPMRAELKSGNQPNKVGNTQEVKRLITMEELYNIRTKNIRNGEYVAC